MSLASFETSKQGESALRLVARGAWTLDNGLAAIDARLRRFGAQSLDQSLDVDVSEIEAMDTAGAMMLQRVMRACGGRVDEQKPLRGFSGLSPRFSQLLEQASEHIAPCEVEPPRRQSFVLMLERLGRGTSKSGGEALSILSFVGAVVARIGRTITRPKKFRFTPLVHHMEEAGLDATLIVGLMSFLIGAVVAFMGAKVLGDFGAEVFSIDLVGISVLREFGVLITAILIAGRSGSAFTAQIGSMKLREEIDAMRVMGIDPLDALVVPRVLALMFTLPVLAFLAAFLGLVGGGVVGWLALDIPPTLFMGRTQEVVLIQNLMVGLIKAPFFAFVIGIVGCYHGMMVENSAEDLGRRTTMAVVQSLFLVMIVNALFAMFFLELNI
ncbi:MAG: ABC transporter permease [Pseudomonadota bacterium]